MKLRLFQTLWGHAGTIREAVSRAQTNGFEGLEGPPPADAATLREWAAVLKNEGVPFIAEISTTGFATPVPGGTVAQHLEAFERGLDRGRDLQPLFFTAMAGSDLWEFADSVRFLSRAYEIADGIPVGFETHRGRSLFHPIRLRELLRELPPIELTVDFSHWCVVTERLVLDELPDVLDLCARRVLHIHARVGYDQGAQAPDPRAPEYANAAMAHLRWWRELWDGRGERGFDTITMTPEFGPDGYLQREPFTQKPVADLDDLNAWTGRWVAGEFRAWKETLREVALP